MEANRALITLLAVVAYLALCVGVGLWSLRRTKSASDFFVAGRTLGMFVTAFAIFSSTMSGFGFVGGPGLMYSMGTSSIWILGTIVISNIIVLNLVAKRLRLVAELRECVSLPDVAAARYGSESVRASVAVVILLGVLGYLATQILAMSIVLQGVLAEAGVLENPSLALCVAISCSVLIFYSVTGGIVASVYTDVIQGAIMVVASALVFVTVLGTFDGGMSEISRIVAADDRAASGPWGTIGLMGGLAWFFVFGIGVAGQPHIITKFMMLRRMKELRYVIPVGVLAYSFAALLWIGIGFAMRALVITGGHPALATPDAASPEFLQAFTHPLLAGVVFAALLAAIMSTADAFLNIGTAAIMHDLPNAIRGRSLGNELAWARAITVLLAISAALVALYSGDLVALLGVFGWGTFAAGLVPVIAIGLNWKRANVLAANVAIASSLLINFGLRSGFGFGAVRLPYGVDHGAAALLVSLVLFLSISFLTKPDPIDRDIERVMEL
ncbi:hypothetical protein [Candidatus Palauibacter soopunensis]|uniref:sodium:solute symporter family transporter n=1 Tax=Candidatus Palauibacter soopunensis TaxID=3056739 RepID=UPI002383E2BC|nr:hypothetical protein [Candidatus Palauibacter soopunensis]MDE2879077.1 hypothetical protein [Candidatus Palauibacter soopunensis]